MTHSDLRKKFIEFWKETPRNHVEIPSSSLVPENDPTTLFTGSGMQPMMPYLLGAEHPLGTRLVDIQKCFRGQDIEEVGDNRHDSFFEMFGNWSLGDYFKEEQISWYWKFLTEVLKLPKDKLYVTVFGGDEGFDKDNEAINIWKSVGVDVNHIKEYGAKKNWWSRAGTPSQMPIGEPGGPDSEVFFEFTHVQHDPKFGEVCHPNCDCGRFVEIGNSVFMTYLKTADGFVPLKKKNIDFGGGLERTLAAVNNDPDIFKTDLFNAIIKQIESLSGKPYGVMGGEIDRNFRVIADHIKAATFLISEGITPSNTDRGYVLRRLLRRAILYGRNMNLTTDSYFVISQSVIETYESAYTELAVEEKKILETISQEANKFSLTLERGLKEFDKLEAYQINELNAFNLYQTYGFPFEVIQEMIVKKGYLPLDKNKFLHIFQKHQELSRSASKGMFKGGLADHSETVTKYHTATHLLHAALRKVLGEHVHQEGSNLTAERLRFDFSYPQKLTDEQIKQVEDVVNEQIKKGLEQKLEVMTYDDAIKSGALAFFKERYPEKVNVYSFGDFSREICGGPHVKNTKDLGKFKIVKEESVSSGTRRIYGQLT